LLIQFRVENYRSLRDEQTLSMVADATLGGKTDERLVRPKGIDEALLPAVAIYGANASGKSNVIGALGFMQSAVVRSQRFWKPDGGTRHEPFALSRKIGDPSRCEVDILIEGTRYRYGFVLSAERVEEEWLFAWPRGRRQTWFERHSDAFSFGKYLEGENHAIRGLTRHNSLFLSAAAQNNHATLSPIFRFFSASQFASRRRAAFRHVVQSRNAWLSMAAASKNRTEDSERQAVLRLLQAADTGILDMRVEEREEYERDPEGIVGGTIGVRRDLFFRHRSTDESHAWLPLHAESDGTLTLLDMSSSLIRTLRNGGLLCVDELEASLHPAVALELMRMFNDPKDNPHGAQIIFTTHDTNLLGSTLGEPALRRDQVWMTEKDEGGGTSLYPLTDFHPRKEENLQRGYLQGRYGAIPFLESFVSHGRHGGDP
jgi:hypothetical protein